MGYVHGIKWDDELIGEKIHLVMNALNISRMPSRQECEIILKDSSLSNKIAKSGGFYGWAKRLGLEVKECETSTGKGFEEVAASMIKEHGYKVQRMSTKCAYDLLVNECIRVDVKAARAYMLKNSRVHTVGLNKMFATCDLYFIFALDGKDNVEKTFIIPGIDLKLTSLNFGTHSKYDIYLDRWDLFEKYNKFYSELA